MESSESPQSSTVSGYYRYTDIAFHYPRTIEDRDEASAFKSAIHYNALGDPSHPLRIDKEKGLEMYIGILPNGQSRLMFSSAQIEYMRYLLHAKGQTKAPLPLPSSECLLTEPILTSVSTVYLKTPSEVKKAYAKVQKNSKRLRNDAKLASYRHNFDRVRELYASKKGTWLAADIEAWTVVRAAITDFGWSYTRWNGSEVVQDHGHFIVKKNMGLRNGQYVADAQDKYNFGTSLELETAEFRKAVRDLFAKLQESGPFFIVFHDGSQDIKFLKNLEYFDEGLTANFEFSLPHETPGEGIFVIDTTELFGALEGDVQQKRSLGDMCRLLNIETQYLHNAGNDAYFTLLALKSMASRNQVDAQREERWPTRELTSSGTGSNLKVVYLPNDEDSDVSLADDEQ